MKQRHYVNVAILWFVLTFVGELALQYLVHYPLKAAAEGVIIDEATQLLFVLALPVFTFSLAIMGYSLVYFRASSRDSLETGIPTRGNTTFSVAWLFVTGALCVTVIVNPGFVGLNKIWANPTADFVVNVTGSQWSWRVEYPDGSSSREELVLPVNKRVKFEVTSTDVQHSFWIPVFRMKIDAVPGRTTEMYVTPTKVGSYDTDQTFRAQCAELCGLDHTFMSMPVRVVEQSEFDSLFPTVLAGAAQPTGAEESQAGSEMSPAERGAQLADKQGCVACHSTDGSTLVGPTWKDLYGSEVSLADGSTLTADEAYLHESIVDPTAKMVQGFSAVMPPVFGKTLAPDQIDDLIAYIKSLSAAGQ